MKHSFFYFLLLFLSSIASAHQQFPAAMITQSSSIIQSIAQNSSVHISHEYVHIPQIKGQQQLSSQKDND